MRILYTSNDGTFRIVEHADQDFDIANLKGDIYTPRHNPDIDPAKLRSEELDFERLVAKEGVYGYELQRWNALPGVGWEFVDSCWGFVGQYSVSDPKFDHYIVDELKAQIPK